MLQPAQYEGLLKAAKNLGVGVSDSLLRDWFAGQALTSTSASGKLGDGDRAKRAYELAEAMMKERRRRYHQLGSLGRRS